MVRFECPYCGQVMQTAQYLNGKGHCLKCDAVVAETVNHPLNPEWVRKMKVKFDKLNTDGDVNAKGYGTLDYEEMSALLRKGNPSMTDDEMRTIFDDADSNGNGTIEFTEFLWYLYGHPAGASASKGRVAASKPVGHRAPGEASTYKLNPSDACESDKGVCPKNNGGPHHFKFGQCQYCKVGEGVLKKGAGTFAYAGGDGGCPKGGKCMYKFSKCSKCGKSEF